LESSVISTTEATKSASKAAEATTATGVTRCLATTTTNRIALKYVLEDGNQVCSRCELETENTTSLWLICLTIDFIDELGYLLLLFSRGVDDH
jgi:hypothetical protein